MHLPFFVFNFSDELSHLGYVNDDFKGFIQALHELGVGALI